MGILRCQKCGTQLIDGPAVEKSGAANGFSVRITNIPTKVCPRGCAGSYWYWPDFGVEVMGGLSPSSPNFAKEKLGFFKRGQFCRNCSVELADKGMKSDFSFSVGLGKGTELAMTINAPSLTCPHCGSVFMPAQKSSYDKYYIHLADTIGAVITQDLIYR